MIFVFYFKNRASPQLFREVLIEPKSVIVVINAIRFKLYGGIFNRLASFLGLKQILLFAIAVIVSLPNRAVEYL
jgi:hypothetical protein